jgi:acyl transferase domain-containing protein
MQSAGMHRYTAEPIAIVGLSCKFAGEASTPDRLWEMLAAGRSAWSEIPPSRFNLKGAYHPSADRTNTVCFNPLCRENPTEEKKVHVRGGHFLEQDLSLFDAQFFSFSAETAAVGDIYQKRPFIPDECSRWILKFVFN